MSISEAEKADWLGENYHGNWEMWVDPVAIHDAIRAQAARIAELTTEKAEQEASFDLRWKADMRAIKRWQEKTGRTQVWPDHADLCVWLLERIKGLEASVRNQQGDNLCWFDGSPPIPPKAEFLESCRRYHDQIATQNGVLEGGRTIAQLEARVVELEAERLPLYSDRIANLEAERDALTAKVAHLYKLVELGIVSLGISCEDRDRLKHSDRELRKCIAELEAERDALRIDSDRMRDQMSCDLERLDGENAAMRRLCSAHDEARKIQLKENAALRKILEEIVASDPHTSEIGPLFGAGYHAAVTHLQSIAKAALAVTPKVGS